MSTAPTISGLIKNLAQRITYSELAKEIGTSETALRAWERGGREVSPFEIRRILRTAYKHGFFDLPPAHGIPPVPYDIGAPCDLTAIPIGFEEDPPVIPLIHRPTKIAGHRVDFPMGVPASVLAVNAKWLKFYARRGFDILTYKTVRTQPREAHPWPNWVFLEDSIEIKEPSNPPSMVGSLHYLPADLTRVSMANSFGVPSFDPSWWQEDMRRAREIVREGHQVLIASIIASIESSEEAIAQDFANAAIMATKAGADIIEANYSCPNVQGDPVGEIYQDPDRASRISQAIQEALKQSFGEKKAPPLFVKIGYLPETKLGSFVELNAKYIDGIVAINTISAKVVDKEGGQIFPNSGTINRATAGISGWSIKERAQEVSRNLVTLRNNIYTRDNKRLTILGMGGILEKQDVVDYLNIGVDGVESCTGAFLKPHLGLEVRFDAEAIKKNRFLFELEVIGKYLEDIAFHPSKRTRIRVDRDLRGVAVEPE